MKTKHQAKVWIYDDSSLPNPGSAQGVWFELRAADIELTSIYTNKTRSTNSEAAELVLFFGDEPVGFINFDADGDCISEIVKADAGEHAWFIKLHCYGVFENGCLKYRARSGKVRQLSHTDVKSMQGINQSICEACRMRNERLESSMASWERVRDGLVGFLLKTAKVGYTWEKATAFFAEKSPVLEVIDSESSKVVLRFCNNDEATKGTIMTVTESYDGELGKATLHFKIYGERDKGAVKPSRQLADTEYIRAL